MIEICLFSSVTRQYPRFKEMALLCLNARHSRSDGHTGSYKAHGCSAQAQNLGDHQQSPPPPQQLQWEPSGFEHPFGEWFLSPAARLCVQCCPSRCSAADLDVLSLIGYLEKAARDNPVLVERCWDAVPHSSRPPPPPESPLM